MKTVCGKSLHTFGANTKATSLTLGPPYLQNRDRYQGCARNRSPKANALFHQALADIAIIKSALRISAKAALHSLPSRVKAYAFHLLDMATAIKVPAANKRGTRSTEGTGDGEYEKN